MAQFIKVTGKDDKESISLNIDHITYYYPTNSGCKVRLSSGTSIRVTQTETEIDELIKTAHK